MGDPKNSKQDLFALVIDTVPGYVSWISSDLKYLGINQAIADAFQTDRASIAGKSLGFHSGTSKHDFYTRVKDFFASPLYQDSFEVKILVDGSERWQLVEAKKYHGGKEALFIGIDISARKQAEEALAREQEERIRDSRLASLGEMAASIVHEIKTPLGVLIGNADLLEEHLQANLVAPERCKTYLGKIQKTAQTITKIIKALQKHSRNGEKDPFEATKLAELVGDSLLICEHVLRTANVEMRTAAIPADFSFEARATQISQVLVNLIKNSAEAISNLPERWIQLDYVDTKDSFELWITDSGPGIPAEVRKKLMQPFFTTKGVGKGTGIGLSLSRRLAEEHQGTLRIDEKCKHTRFILTLPKLQKPASKEKIAA